MPKGKRRQNNEGITIIRREVAVEAGSHGGAWKVAYADFVTALMAFFLLMWLLNATTEDQRKGLADYFSPTNLMSHNSSGTGQPFGGHTAFDSGALLSDRGSIQITQGNRPILTDADQDDQEIPVQAGEKGGQSDTRPVAKQPPQAQTSATQSSQSQTVAAAQTAAAAKPSDSNAADAKPAAPSPDTRMAEQAAQQAAERAAQRAEQETAVLKQAAEEIRQAVSGDKALGDLTQHLSIDLTPQGLRIQILDSPNEPMFALGSATPNDLTRTLLGQIAPVLKKLSEPIAIDGHTDAARYPGTTMTNWELSTNRANAARRMLVDNGLPEERIKEVTGHADRALLLPSDPLAAANRRVAITVLRSVPAAPPALPPKPNAARVEPAPGQADTVQVRAVQTGASQRGAAQKGTDSAGPGSPAAPVGP